MKPRARKGDTWKGRKGDYGRKIQISENKD